MGRLGWIAAWVLTGVLCYIGGCASRSEEVRLLELKYRDAMHQSADDLQRYDDLAAQCQTINQSATPK